MPITQKTIRYKTYVKQVLVEALRSAIVVHPDSLLERTKVELDFSQDRNDYPTILVRFYERKINNAGVGHHEWLPVLDNNGDPVIPKRFHKYKHYLYSGDVEFAIYALSSEDRDLVADALIEIIAMGDLESYTSGFSDRLYAADPTIDPQSLVHFISMDTDNIQGFGESQVIAPWMPEDTLVYQTSYRVQIMGEFYSLVPAINPPVGLVEHVNTYPYDPLVGEPVPNPDPTDPAPWIGAGDDSPYL